MDQPSSVTDAGTPELGAGRLSEPWKDREAAVRAWERDHETEWVRIDGELRGIAVRRGALDAEEAHLLRYAEEIKLWRGYGFGSMLEYIERVMGYAPHTAMERLRVARAIGELPLIAEALENGELSHSAVRELSRVAVPESEGVWLDAARGKSLREVEAMVSGHKPGDLPDDEIEPRLHRRTITLEVSPETYDIWRKMHALAAEEHGQRLSDDELIPAVFRRAYAGGEKGSPPAYKIAIKQCPDCKRAWQYSGGRDIEIDSAAAECAACDAVHLGSLDTDVPARTTTTVTARKREQVLARDSHCCTVPGCRRNVGLDLHHIVYQSRGGSHDLSNVTTICDLHHRAAHRGKLVIRGAAPDHLAFEFRKPRDRRNVTDDDGPAAHGAFTANTGPVAHKGGPQQSAAMGKGSCAVPSELAALGEGSRAVPSELVAAVALGEGSCAVPSELAALGEGSRAVPAELAALREGRRAESSELASAVALGEDSRAVLPELAAAVALGEGSRASSHRRDCDARGHRADIRVQSHGGPSSERARLPNVMVTIDERSTQVIDGELPAEALDEERDGTGPSSPRRCEHR